MNKFSYRVKWEVDFLVNDQNGIPSAEIAALEARYIQLDNRSQITFEVAKLDINDRPIEWRQLEVSAGELGFNISEITDAETA
jgi:hypothetical protein